MLVLCCQEVEGGAWDSELPFPSIGVTKEEGKGEIALLRRTKVTPLRTHLLEVTSLFLAN